MRTNFACEDCSANVLEVGEYCYMLRDELWYWVARDCLRGFLCLGCLEERLGRPLAEGDLKPGVLINEYSFIDRSERMRERVEKWR